MCRLFIGQQERVCSLKDRLVMVFIDQMLNILVWDDFGSIKLSNRLFGVGTILVKFWNLGKMRKFGTLTWMYIHKYVGDS